ncbi:hypothetical protein B0H66DRAFT_605918 [Apodospora peruviana]|uniref:Uncharacterized protein n=1 Tax=Apodospora peruviana TaxID=516989 RepID=A0AAE0HYI9_9PEZI|nr:hypothetical protein B0H66DRAFT_605918 [Apodospora peruviana]
MACLKPPSQTKDRYVWTPRTKPLAAATLAAATLALFHLHPGTLGLRMLDPICNFRPLKLVEAVFFFFCFIEAACATQMPHHRNSVQSVLLPPVGTISFQVLSDGSARRP